MTRAAAAAMAGVLAGCSGVGCSSDADPAPVVDIEYVAHAAFRIHSEAGTTVLVDPFASRVWLGYDFPDSMLAADVVAITHPHYDHDYGELINRPVPWTGEQTVLRDAGTFTVGDVMLTGVSTKHHDPYGQEFGQKNVVWVIEIDGVRIAHLGDTAPLEAEAVTAIGRVDVLMAPIDSTEHILTYAELDAIRAQLAPRTVVPMHYRIPDLEIDPASPQDLGPVEPWLDQQTDVMRLEVNHYEVSIDTVDALPEVIAFSHSPLVVAAGQTAANDTARDRDACRFAALVHSCQTPQGNADDCKYTSWQRAIAKRARKRIEQLTPALDTCVRAASKGGSLNGRVSLRGVLTDASTGGALRVTTTNTTGDADLPACMKRHVEGIELPAMKTEMIADGLDERELGYELTIEISCRYP